jgi:hypothetical protein
MRYCNRILTLTAACALVVAFDPFQVAAQQTTKGGILVENAVNRPERPYRPAGSSDPRDRGPQVASGFGERDRRLVYVAVPGGSAGGQFSSKNGKLIRMVSQLGEGIPSTVQSRLSDRPVTAASK